MLKRIRGDAMRWLFFGFRWALLVCSSLLLGGCVTDYGGNDAHLYPGLFGQKISGNEAYVTISNVWNEMDALPLADRHCSQYGKVAKFSRMEPYRAIFDCVAKGAAH